MVEGPVDGGIVTYTLAVVNISISPQPNERATREHARNEKRSVQLQKKNNLLSVASIHFHSKRQQLVFDKQSNEENCWYGLTEDSDKHTEQILYAFKNAWPQRNNTQENLIIDQVFNPCRTNNPVSLLCLQSGGEHCRVLFRHQWSFSEAVFCGLGLNKYNINSLSEASSCDHCSPLLLQLSHDVQDFATLNHFAVIQV